MARREGEIIIVDPDLPAPVHGRTIQCVHCGRHWIPKPGSKKVRGFCMKCNGPFCGKKCQECIPHERYIEILEMGLNPHEIDLSRLPKQF